MTHFCVIAWLCDDKIFYRYNIEFLGSSRYLQILKVPYHGLLVVRALINPILTQNSSYRFSFKLETPSTKGSRSYFKEYTIYSHMARGGGVQNYRRYRGGGRHGCIAINIPVVFAEIVNCATIINVLMAFLIRRMHGGLNEWKINIIYLPTLCIHNYCTHTIIIHTQLLYIYNYCPYTIIVHTQLMYTQLLYIHN